MLQDAAALSCYLEIVRAESGGILRVGVIPSILSYFLLLAFVTSWRNFPQSTAHARGDDR